MRPRSLARTGVIVLLAAVAMSAAASVLLLWTRNTNVIALTEAENLTARALAVAHSLQRGEAGEGWEIRLPQELAARFDPTYGRSFYAVLDVGGRPILSSMDPIPGEVPFIIPNADADEVATFRVRRGEMVLHGISVPVRVEGTPLVVQVADDVGHPDLLTDDIANEFMVRVTWVVLPVYAALGLIAVLTVRRFMRPIERLSKRANDLLTAPPGERLSEEEAPTELRSFVRSMNAMLARAEQLGAVQRQFTAEAAHQMRTPLAVLMTHAELIQDRRTGELLAADIGALERIVEQLLALAEIDAISADDPGKTVDLAVLADAAIGFVEPLAVRSGIALRLAAPAGPVEVPGHEEPLHQAILNLIHNAIEHSPAGGSVLISVSAPGCVEVSDQGPGIPPQQRQLVFRRFWRGPGERRGGKRGAGLGLAIVQRVAELHGGTVAVCESASGGALFRLDVSGKRGSPAPRRASQPSPDGRAPPEGLSSQHLAGKSLR